MESRDAKDNEDDDDFFDALDGFPSDDFSATDQRQLSTSGSSLYHLEPVTDQSDGSQMPKTSSEIAYADKSFRRRPSASRRIAVETPSLDSTISSENSVIDDVRKMSSRKKRLEIYRNLKDNGKQLEASESYSVQASSLGGSSSVNEDNNEESAVTTVDNNPSGDLGDSVTEPDDSSSNILVFIAGLLIKAIGIQINLFIYSISFPVWFLYHSYTFVLDPFRAITLGKAYLVGKLFEVWEIVAAVVGPLICKRLKERKSIWKVVLRCAWGLFWSAYVCFVLCGLLISALIFSGFFMRYLVEEPIKMKEILNFDYTKQSPEACMPILPHSNNFYGQNCKENIEIGRTKSRVIPPHHKLQVTVSLTLPESEYNRNLGVFQVKVDFLSVSAEILASSSQPCMLQFKSEPIRLLLIFLKIAPLVTGYVSESQTLNVKIRGFTEGNIPTACLRVTIEQRAEFNPGAGIPEIYDASLILESELPLFKRIIWYWRKTIYIWISMTSFMMQLLFTLVCCRPIILPRTRRRDGSANASSMSNSVSAQR